MATDAILARCDALGVVLSIAPGGGLAFDGPADAMDDGLLAELRNHRAELVAMLCGVADGVGIQSPLILCPWCRLGDGLAEDPEGLRCDRCGRAAWRLVGDAIERVDYVALLPFTPIEHATPSAVTMADRICFLVAWAVS